MAGLTTEILAILAAGGMAQAVLLVTLQALYLKRSSIGVRLESLRTEVAQRDRDIRVWVKDSLAQVEADSMTRDSDLRREFMNLRDGIHKSVTAAMMDEGNLKTIAEYVGAVIVTKLLESRQVRRELALLAEDEDAKRARQRKERGGGDGS
jgi:hypothetical protein